MGIDKDLTLCYNTQYKEILSMEIQEKSNDILNKYKKELVESKKYSSNTINAYYDDVVQFFEELNRSPEEITDREIIVYLRKDAPSTALRRLSSIKNFYKITNKLGIVKNSPIYVGIISELREIPERYSIFMEEEDAINFINVAKKNIKYYAMMLTFLNIGIRETELAYLQKKDYYNGKLRYIAKGNVEKIATLPEGTVQAIDNYLKTRKDDLPYLFISNKKGHYSASGIINVVKSIAKEAGVHVKLSPHKLRHTFANKMIDDGADILTLQEMMGHKNIQTTRGYVRNFENKKATEMMSKGAFNV
jgi:integrase/recombinase XerD